MALKMDNLKNIVESLIFVSDGPLRLDQIRTVLPDVDPKQIRGIVEGLIKEYEERPRGFYLREIAGGVQFRSRPEYKEHVAGLMRHRPPRLSKAALETLAIIAYRQPIIRADIEHLRGVDSGGVLRLLLERKLVRVLGKQEIPGRPLIYATTKRFLELFELKNLRELPTPKEIEALGLSEEERYHPSHDKVTVVQSAQKRTTEDRDTHPNRSADGNISSLPMIDLEQNIDTPPSQIHVIQRSDIDPDNET